MIDITEQFRGVAKYHCCPDCGNDGIRLYDDFTWVCRQCGWEEKDQPGAYLTPGEYTDWKCGMWTPNVGKRTSLLIAWQLFEDGKEIDSDIIGFDGEDGSLKMWLTLYLIRQGRLGNRELRFRLYDKRELEGDE